MLILDPIKPWQGETDIQQMLIFPSKFAQEEYYAKNKLDPSVENGIGAMYKMRSIEVEPGLFRMKIFCGVTGIELPTHGQTYESSEIAFEAGRIFMYFTIGQALRLD